MDMIDFEGRKVPATYLGDAVYAIYDDLRGVWLRLNDHRNTVGQIYLEPPVMDNLNRFIKECRQAQEMENEREESENLASTNNP